MTRRLLTVAVTIAVLWGTVVLAATHTLTEDLELDW